MKREPPPATSPYGDDDTVMKTLQDPRGDGPWLSSIPAVRPVCVVL